MISICYVFSSQFNSCIYFIFFCFSGSTNWIMDTIFFSLFSLIYFCFIWVFVRQSVYGFWFFDMMRWCVWPLSKCIFFNLHYSRCIGHIRYLCENRIVGHWHQQNQFFFLLSSGMTQLFTNVLLFELINRPQCHNNAIRFLQNDVIIHQL